MKWNDDKTSKVWGEILQHKFFKAFHKDLYIEDLLTVIANKVNEMEQAMILVSILSEVET